jgi:hypothetical protein
MRHRKAFGARPLLVCALVFVAVGAAPVAARGATLQVVPIGNGTVAFSPAPQVADPADRCSAAAVGAPDDLLDSTCTLTYAAGTVVTLTATGAAANPATTFRRWSDDRCAALSSCTVTVRDGEQTVAAVFSPQRVSIKRAGAGTVVSAPAGLHGAGADCSSAGDTDCTLDVDVDSAPVVLTGTADPATDSVGWLPATEPRRPLLCDSIVGATCTVLPAWPRWAAVGFGGLAPDAVPSEVTVTFRVAKAGNGSGTVRGAVDCGSSCSIQRSFGTSETLTAVPDSGSRFGGWRAACGSNPTCSLAVGPVTSLTAVFQSNATGGGATNPAGKQPPSRAFAARVLGLRVTGHGRRRVLSIRLRVNATATVRAGLLRGRRQVATHRWRVRTGPHVLRMRVPARARPGTYKVRLNMSGPGRTVRLTRSVRVRR